MNDLRSFLPLCTKGTGESTLRRDSQAPLMYSDPGDLGSYFGSSQSLNVVDKWVA